MRKSILEKMETLRKEHFENMQKILWDNEKALAIVEERKAVFEENKDLRAKNQEAREEFRGARSDLIVKYKSALAAKVTAKLDTMSDTKLELLLWTIDKLIANIEKNTKLTQDKKDATISQYTAVKELIQEKLDNSTASMENIDIDSLLQ
jgi:hypothetical protein